MPTLGLWSSGDTYLWEEQMQRSEALMDAPWRYQRIDNALHWLMLEQSERVIGLLLEWLTGA